MKIDIGDIFLIENDEVYPAKKKLSICVYVQQNWFFLINSENRKNYDCIPILKKDNEFLAYDSFVSCSRYFQYKPDKIKKSKYLGKLQNNDILRILKKVIQSEILEQSAIEIISQSLDEYLESFNK